MDWKRQLELIGVPIAISPLHDKDKSNVEGQIYKKAHYHVVYVTKNPVTSDSIRKRIQRVLLQTLWSSFVKRKRELDSGRAEWNGIHAFQNWRCVVW